MSFWRWTDPKSSDEAADAQRASDALLETKLQLNLETVSTEGYQTLAEMGHDLNRRDKYFPRYIKSSASERLTRLGVGFRGVVYSIGHLVLKTNFSLSFEVEHEFRIHQRSYAQLAATNPSWIESIEPMLGIFCYEPNEHPIVGYKFGPSSDYFGREVILMKGLIDGPDIDKIIKENGPAWFDKEKVWALARLFRAFGDSGIRLQGDPTDFLWTGDWIAIDADGWLIYEPHHSYCLYACKRNFLGVFTREWAPGAPGRIDWSKDTVGEMDSLLKIVEEAADAIFHDVSNPYDTNDFEQILLKDDLLNPADSVVRSLIRYELEDPFRLDSELATCNLNVLLSRRSVFDELLELRGVSGLESFYFRDVQEISQGEWIAFYSPFNDATTVRDYVANHTGVSNLVIAEHVLVAAQSRT